MSQCNAGYEERGLSTLVLTVLALSMVLWACSDNEEQGNAPSTTGAPEMSSDDEMETQYREKVKRRVSASVVSSFSREWGVSESAVECVLADVGVTQLDDAASDAAVAAVFEKCDIDPSMVK